MARSARSATSASARDEYWIGSLRRSVHLRAEEQRRLVRNPAWQCEIVPGGTKTVVGCLVRAEAQSGAFCRSKVRGEADAFPPLLMCVR